jgi:hypothetical protein
MENGWLARHFSSIFNGRTVDIRETNLKVLTGRQMWKNEIAIVIFLLI